MHGYAKVLQDEVGPSASADGKIYLQRIITAAERMDELIQDVLSYSQISSLDLKPEPIELEQLIREIIQHYPSLSLVERQGGIRIESPLPRVTASTTALSQCISN
jgi:light-regulated signal transduction histidine kinase (bacteriophytochrome)